MTTPRREEMVEEFEKDFRDYLDACIAYCEVQEPYQPMSAEDEIKWLKEYLTKALTQAHQAGIDEAVEITRKHLLHKLDLNNVLEGYEHYWEDMGNGDYIEKCIECENDGRILKAIEALDDTIKALQDNK